MIFFFFFYFTQINPSRILYLFFFKEYLFMQRQAISIQFLFNHSFDVPAHVSPLVLYLRMLIAHLISIESNSIQMFYSIKLFMCVLFHTRLVPHKRNFLWEITFFLGITAKSNKRRLMCLIIIIGYTCRTKQKSNQRNEQSDKKCSSDKKLTAYSNFQLLNKYSLL